MAKLRRGDDELHYSDSSHRWIAPPDVDQQIWNAVVRAHMDAHLTTMGGPVKPDELWECGPPHPTPPEQSIPRRRSRPRSKRHAGSPTAGTDSRMSVEAAVNASVEAAVRVATQLDTEAA
jgi:hypothetical protein